MPQCTEHEPHNIFTEDLFQSTSFIDLLEDSPDVNMTCYMSDEELGLPPMLPSTSELSPTDNVLEMISQDVMFGNNLQRTISKDSTEVTYVTQSKPVSVAPFTSAGDVFLPPLPITSAANTFVKPYLEYVSPSSTNEISQDIARLNPWPVSRLSNLKPATSQSTNPFVVNPFISTKKQLVKNPYLAMARVDPEKARDLFKTSSNSSKKSKCSRGSHRRNQLKLKKTSRSSSKGHSAFEISSSKKGDGQTSSSRDTRSTALTETVTRTTNIGTAALTTKTVTQTTTVNTAQTIDLSTANTACTSVTSSTVSSVVGETGAIGAVKSLESTSTLTSYTVTKTRAPTSVISPIQSTYLPNNVLYSTPTVISRTAPSAAAPADRVREQFAILPSQTAYTIPPSASETNAAPRRTRLVIPVSLNAFAKSSASVDTTTASTVHTHRAVHAVRPFQSVNAAASAPTHTASTTTSNVMARTLTHSSYALPPGATLYAARKFTKSRSQAPVTTESHTYAIVDGKGTYTTLTISSDFTTTTGSSPLVMTQTQNTAGTAGSNTSPVASDSLVMPRSQLLIPIANSQMNTSTSLGYLVTSPIGTDKVTSCSSTVAPSALSATTATTVTTHTITTISSEALNRIRNRLIYNVPSPAGPSQLQSTMTTDSNRPRGPVTIIANQLISGVRQHEGAVTSGTTATRPMFSAASQGLYAIAEPITTVSSTTSAEPPTRPLNRVVIPINVHGTSTSHSSVSTQGAYIIAGMGSTAGDSVTRPSRVVIPIIHKTSATTMPSTCETATARPCPATASTIASTDSYSKLRSRLTIQMSTAESTTPGTTTPMTAYTITRTRAPQSAYATPAGSTPYISSTKTSEGSRSPATMTLITFAPPSTSGASIKGAPQRSLAATRCDTPSTNLVTSATPTLSSSGNRFVIKLSGPGAASASSSSVTASITTPITSAALSPTQHHFMEPHSLSTRLRTFPGPRTYSIAQRSAVGNAPQRPVARNVNPRVKRVISNPAPLQIFADVVCPPKTAPAQTTTMVTQSNSKARYTLSHSPGSSTLVVPQYKNTVFKNLSTIAHPNPERTNPQPSSEGLVLNRSVALVSPRRSAGGSGSQRDSRSSHADLTPCSGRDSPASSGSSTQSPSSNNTHTSSNQDDQND